MPSQCDSTRRVNFSNDFSRCHRSAAFQWFKNRRAHAPDIPLSALEEAIGLSLATAGEWHGRLTPREAEVAALMATGRPNRQIADELEIAAWTLANHGFRLMDKLEAETTAAVAHLFNLVRLADVAGG
jgi:DNA-binding CsgD family transcriptional regulator